nr:RNA polymerase sigma factor [Anaerolineae bacterium]
VMGYSLVEISELLNATVPEIKATLHRGRTKLRELAATPEVRTPHLDVHEQELLARYVDRFNARDFDTLRMMLTDEVHLDLVNRVQLQGAAAIENNYFHHYSLVYDWRMAVGTVEGHPAIVAYDLDESSSVPAYFILLAWDNNQVSSIRDFHYARYVLRDAAVTIEK